MGCLMALFQNSYALTPTECIHKLREIESVLHKMVEKYKNERTEAKQMAHRYVAEDQRVLAMACLRRIKVLDHHLGSISLRITACEQKRLAVENINSMKLEVDAMEDTNRAFKSFLKNNDLTHERIQKLQDSLQQAILDTCDIQETLSEDMQPLLYDDSELEEELKNMMLTSNIKKVFPEVPSVHPVFERETSPLPYSVSGRSDEKKALTANIF